MGGGVSRQRRASPAALPPSPSPAAFSSSSSQEPNGVGKNGEDRRITKEVTSEEKEDFRVESESDLHHHDEDDEDDFEHEEDYESKLFAEDQGGSLSQTAMSFDMDDNDLLFNLLYFNENPEGLDTSNIGAICETAVTETLAAHSEGNTPYKLRPASEKAQAEFDGTEKLTEDMYQKLDSTECSICLEEMLIDCKIAYLKCNHCFHCDCFLRWIKLQGFCPVCKTVLDSDIDSQEDTTANTNTNTNEEKITTARCHAQGMMEKEKEEDKGNDLSFKQLHAESPAAVV